MKSIKKMNVRLKRQELMTKQHSAVNSIKHSSTFNLVAHLMKMMISKLLTLYQHDFYGQRTPYTNWYPEVVAQRFFVKKVFLEISQNSQEKRPWHRCFPVNFAKFLRTPLSYRTPPVAASRYLLECTVRNFSKDITGVFRYSQASNIEPFFEYS